MLEANPPNSMAAARNQRGDEQVHGHQQHRGRGEEETVELAGPRSPHEQEQASARCTEMGTTWQEEERETAWNLEKDSGDGDEGSGKDLERAQLACPRSRCLETICWRLVLRPECGVTSGRRRP